MILQPAQELLFFGGIQFYTQDLFSWTTKPAIESKWWIRTLVNSDKCIWLRWHWYIDRIKVVNKDMFSANLIWTTLPKSGGAMHRDAVTFVIDDPGEKKKIHLAKLFHIRLWAEVFDVKLKLCCRLRAEANYLKEQWHSCGHVSKIQVCARWDIHLKKA